MPVPETAADIDQAPYRSSLSIPGTIDDFTPPEVFAVIGGLLADTALGLDRVLQQNPDPKLIAEAYIRKGGYIGDLVGALNRLRVPYHVIVQTLLETRSAPLGILRTMRAAGIEDSITAQALRTAKVTQPDIAWAFSETERIGA